VSVILRDRIVALRKGKRIRRTAMRMASMLLRIGSVLLGLEMNAAQVQAGDVLAADRWPWC
jgi:hypothetical protein